MTRRRIRRWMLTVVALATGSLLVTSVPRLDDVPSQLFQLVALCYLIPGAMVVLRRDGHLIGWLLVANGLLWAVQLSSEVADGGLSWLPLAWRAWTNHWVGYAQWSATVALFVLFPDGLGSRTPSQRRAGRAMIVTALAATIASMLSAEVGGDTLGSLHPNPTGLGFLPRAITEFAIVPVGVAGLGAVVGLARRARHVTGAARRQYTWVLFAFGLVIAGLVCGLTLGGVLGDAAWLPIVVGWFLVPTAFSVAILRHRLYDIDRIVSRTVAYAVITVVVAAVYAVPVVVLPELFGVRGPLPVAAATLAAAAVFSPVRRAVQRWVDRRFNRARFDARRELDAFAGRLRSEVDLDTVVADINALVDTALQPRTAATWIRPVVPPP